MAAWQHRAAAGSLSFDAAAVCRPFPVVGMRFVLRAAGASWTPAAAARAAALLEAAVWAPRGAAAAVRREVGACAPLVAAKLRHGEEVPSFLAAAKTPAVAMSTCACAR